MKPDLSEIELRTIQEGIRRKYAEVAASRHRLLASGTPPARKACSNWAIPRRSSRNSRLYPGLLLRGGQPLQPGAS